jgi:hypothetical protein
MITRYLGERCQECAFVTSSEKIFGNSLTTFDIEPDGSRFCMNVADESGQQRGLSLPTECLTQLIMTLPEMASKALRLRYRDNTLRIVYPLCAMHVEATHIDQFTILTLSTANGFTVSFGLTADNLQQLEATVRDAQAAERPEFVRN